MFSQNCLQERLNSLSEHSPVCWGDLGAVVTARGRNTPALGTRQSQDVPAGLGQSTMSRQPLLLPEHSTGGRFPCLPSPSLVVSLTQ